jgi:hypothetical protein
VQPENFTSQVQDEVEWARALSAIVLAVKLEFAEQRAATVYQSVAAGTETTTD